MKPLQKNKVQILSPAEAAFKRLPNFTRANYINRAQQMGVDYISLFQKEQELVLDSHLQHAVPYQQNLDNCTNAEQDVPEEGGNLMAQKRERVITGYNTDGDPIYTTISGKTQDERQVKAIIAMAESGRLWEILPSNYLMDRLPLFAETPSAGESKPTHPLEDVAQDWYNKHLPSKIQAEKLSDGLRKSYNSYMNNHVIAYFGKTPIENIRHCDVQEFINSRVNPKTEEFYAAGTINIISSILGQILDYAVTQDIISANPMHKAPIINPSNKKSTRIPLSKEDLVFVRSQIPNLKTENERLFMTLLAHLPYRKCEALGQRWEAINFDKKTCQVTGDVVIENGQAVYHEGKAKNQYSLRVMCASDTMMEALKPYRKSIGFVLNTDGAHLTRREIDAMWYSIKKQIPLLEEKGITPYCFRHTLATIMYHETKDIVAVSYQCGHKNSRITKEVYVHDDLNHRRLAMEQMERALSC